MANNIVRFDRDGLEILIDTVTGEAFSSVRGYARMAEKSEGLIRKRIKGAYPNGLESRDVPTPGGFQGATLIPAKLVFRWLIKDNPELAEKMGEVGATVFLHQLAGYRVSSTATQRQLTREEIRAALIQAEPDIWKPRFKEEYYSELSRLTGLVQTGTARPYHWANLTLELFYDYLPGELTIALKAAKKQKGDWQKLHQFLTEDGRDVFAENMRHLLQTMKDADSINDVRRALRRHYGAAEQLLIFADNRKDGKLIVRKDLYQLQERN